MNGMHHLQKRRFDSKNIEPTLTEKKLIRTVDRFAYLSILVPILTIPQLTTVFIHHSASDLSLISWLTYLVSAGYWTYYGWLHKAAPIWFPNILMVLVDLGVVVGILLYK